MAHPPTEEDTLDQLQTPEQVALLDTIDELRNQGLGHHGINLPQLIVCGNQSSGKSSLLEGLTRLRFPSKDELCTTFATEVVLRRDTHVQILCEITPSKTRSPIECREFAKFKRTFNSREEFPFQALHNEAKKLFTGGVVSKLDDFFEDVLRVRYSGPDMPSFTIVDLPGIFAHKLHSGTAAADKVAQLVTGYMANEKSIILAVIEAKAELEHQRVFTYLEEYDPKNLRTMGIITKPDLLDKGSNSEKKMLRLAKNEEYPLKYHWHTVRNRGFATMDQSDNERDEAEEQFFAAGLWMSIPRKHVGISALRKKLSHVLLEHIGMELPSLVTAIQSAVEATESGLKALGHTRENSKEQRSYLTGHAEEFQLLIHDALRGIYSNNFFALASPDENAPTRLRTAIQNLNIAFAHVMYRKGHSWDMASDHPSIGDPRDILAASSSVAQEYGNCFEDPVSITRAEFLEHHIGGYVRQSRPSGLPSLVNPWVIGEVFRQQSRNWSKIAKHHLQQIFQAMRDFIEEALSALIDARTCSLLMLNQIQPELDRRWRSVDTKLEELLVPYTEQDPITYDPGFIQDLEKMRAARYRTNTDFQARSTQSSFNFGLDSSTRVTSNSSQRLLTESLDDFTNSEILDLMQTYYKSAISVFINNVAVLAIENCLLKNLSAIFSPTLIANMDDEQLFAIAAESEEIRLERTLLRAKLESLQSGKNILYKHIAMSPASRVKKPSQGIPQIVENAMPHTPKSEKPETLDDRTDGKKYGTMLDLTTKLNNMVVTPPTSGSNSRASSRPRVDLVNGTPSMKGSARKPSPRRWPRQSGVLGPEILDGSEEEL